MRGQSALIGDRGRGWRTGSEDKFCRLVHAQTGYYILIEKKEGGQFAPTQQCGRVIQAPRRHAGRRDATPERGRGRTAFPLRASFLHIHSHKVYHAQDHATETQPNDLLTHATTRRRRSVGRRTASIADIVSSSPPLSTIARTMRHIVLDGVGGRKALGWRWWSEWVTVVLGTR